MRKTRRARPAFWIAWMALGAGTVHYATRAYTLYVDTGDVTVNGPVIVQSSKESDSAADSPVLNNEQETFTITVVKQHSSTASSSRSADN